mgnify:CR=1 FL=1
MGIIQHVSGCAAGRRDKKQHARRLPSGGGRLECIRVGCFRSVPGLPDSAHHAEPPTSPVHHRAAPPPPPTTKRAPVSVETACATASGFGRGPGRCGEARNSRNLALPPPFQTAEGGPTPEDRGGLTSATGRLHVVPGVPVPSCRETAGQKEDNMVGRAVSGCSKHLMLRNSCLRPGLLLSSVVVSHIPSCPVT